MIDRDYKAGNRFRVFCEKHNKWEYYTLGDLVCGAATSSNGEGGVFKSDTWGLFIGMLDKNKKDIYDGDIGEVKTESGETKRFVVKWGIHQREMGSGWLVDIPGFCFEVDGKATFPIADNYLGGHDLDIIEIVGNIYENKELLTIPIN